jgi:hypothetical protein
MDSTSDYMMKIHESDDEDLVVEDFIERQRKCFRVKHFKKGRKKELIDRVRSLDEQPPERSSKYYREARQTSATASSSADPTETHRVSQHSFDSTPIALFGRAVSMLLQGGIPRKRRSKYGRCAFFVLDNADRMLAWKKSGSRNALAQLFKLPSVMGINLTLIFISRGALLTYSGEVCCLRTNCYGLFCSDNVNIPFLAGLRSHKSPGMITDAVHPISIYFDSYTSVDTMKKVSFSYSEEFVCLPHMCLTRHSNAILLSDILYFSYEANGHR